MPSNGARRFALIECGARDCGGVLVVLGEVNTHDVALLFCVVFGSFYSVNDHG